jgi:guanylate kinase
MDSTGKNGILILTGPSGAGKTTLSKAIVEQVPDTMIMISYTTRERRPGEVDGKDYFFVDKTVFQKLIDDGEMLEYAQVYDHFYGTSRSAIEKVLGEGKNIILDVDWQGAKAVKKHFPQAVSVYILPPGESETRDRLQNRGEDSQQIIDSRMAAYNEQLSHRNEFDHVLINGDLAESIRQLREMAPF